MKKSEVKRLFEQNLGPAKISRERGAKTEVEEILPSGEKTITVRPQNASLGWLNIRLQHT